MQKLENIMLLYSNKITTLLFIYYLNFSYLIKIKFKKLESRTRNKLFFVVFKRKSFFKFVIFLNKKKIYFKNVKKSFLKKYHRKIRFLILRKYIKKVMKFIVLKITLTSKIYFLSDITIAFKLYKKVQKNKVFNSRYTPYKKKKRYYNVIKWSFFNIFRKILESKINYKFNFLFVKSHSKIREKLKKIRRT